MIAFGSHQGGSIIRIRIIVRRRRRMIIIIRRRRRTIIKIIKIIVIMIQKDKINAFAYNEFLSRVEPLV